jgi:hypothetical protein
MNLEIIKKKEDIECSIKIFKNKKYHSITLCNDA